MVEVLHVVKGRHLIAPNERIHILYRLPQQDAASVQVEAGTLVVLYLEASQLKILGNLFLKTF